MNGDNVDVVGHSQTPGVKMRESKRGLNIKITKNYRVVSNS